MSELPLWLEIVVGTFIILAVLMSVWRIIKGPTISDRIVGLDASTTITMVLLVMIGFFSNRYIYLDVSLVYGILAFLGVVALARYFEGGL